MNRTTISLALALPLAIAACQGSGVSTAINDVTTACNIAGQASAIAQNTVKGGALNTVNNIGAYVSAACGTASAIAAIANEPTTLAWLNQLTGGLGALTSAAKS